MEPEVALTPYTPNRAIPKILGILNIVFASLILIWGLCQIASTAAAPVMQKAIKEAQEKQKAELEARVKEAAKQLEAEEKAAKTEEEKAEIREAAKATGRPKAIAVPMFDITRLMGLSDKRLVGWTWVELSTAIVINVAMLVAGIGLVSFKPWGRILSLWVAGIKIIRLVAIYGYAAIVIVPPFARVMGEEVGTMMVQQQQAMGSPVPPGMPELFIKTYTVMFTVMCVVMIIAGSVYPIISIWLLSRPSAKAACSVSQSKPKQTDTW